MRGASCIVLLLLTAGCSDLLGGLTRPDLPVKQSPVQEGGWNIDPRFVVLVDTPEAHTVRIVAKGATTLQVEEPSSSGNPVQITLPDGTWTITYYVDGHKWTTLRDVRIDATPPSITGLERVGDAQDGTFLLGAGAVVEPGAQVQVFHVQGTRSILIATSLPHELTGLGSGLHVYRVVATDAAGNQNVVLAQVRAGDAKALPAGQWDFGIVARYANEGRIWDIADLGAYATPGAAASQVGGKWLGAGYGVTPDDPAVMQVVAAVVHDGQTTAEIAWDLFRWMLDNLEYDEERLDSTTLMLPRQVIQDSEDPDAERDAAQDAGSDGLADDGTGNGVPGGVCRDLAATYVSLLRAAGVPARLVTGYLAGRVDGFHAWVEFYGGDVAGNPGPWVPVDISPLDGRWDDDQQGLAAGFATAMASFGIKHADYLPLRALPDESAGWSAAISTSYTYPQASGPPTVRFAKDVIVEGQPLVGSLCFSEDRARSFSTSRCSGYGFPEYVIFTQRVLDYGIEVDRAGPQTRITAQVAYPFEDSVAPDDVTFAVYGAPYETQDGKVEAELHG